MVHYLGNWLKFELGRKQREGQSVLDLLEGFGYDTSAPEGTRVRTQRIHSTDTDTNWTDWILREQSHPGKDDF